MDRIDMSQSNFDPKSGTNWRIVVQFQRQKSDGTWESVRVPISSSCIIAFQAKGITVWATRHPKLDANEKNWCDMKKELLENQEKMKGRPVDVDEMLSWSFDDREVEVAQNAQPELPQQPQPELHQQAPPPPQTNAAQEDERSTLAGKSVQTVYKVLVEREGAVRVQRNGSPEPQDSSSDSSSDNSPEPKQPARPMGALGGAAAKRKWPSSRLWQRHENRKQRVLAALRIQCAWRQHRARRELQERKVAHARRTALVPVAALRIQCAWRQLLARRELQARKVAHAHRMALVPAPPPVDDGTAQAESGQSPLGLFAEYPGVGDTSMIDEEEFVPDTYEHEP